MKLEALSQMLSECPPSQWRDAALLALDNSNLSYAGSGRRPAGAKVKDLLPLYQFRLEHVRRKGINAVGMPELLQGLKEKPLDSIVIGYPFHGDTSAVHVFCDEQDAIIGCVTITIE